MHISRDRESKFSIYAIFAIDAEQSQRCVYHPYFMRATKEGLRPVIFSMLKMPTPATFGVAPVICFSLTMGKNRRVKKMDGTCGPREAQKVDDGSELELSNISRENQQPRPTRENQDRRGKKSEKGGLS